MPAESTAGGIGLMEGVDPPGFATVLHRHQVAELWYIIEGHYTYYAGDRRLEAGAGAVVYVPGGVPHGLRAGTEGGRKLTIFVPGGTEKFFRDVHDAREVGELTAERARELSERYGLERLGPLPE
ncbi:cupin domain-containing protein [Nonomuraea sp. B12E4]|uniref:cupin domain-containing protein n=1 Tax=Nonomuraea sp. B12E4 TaxID=3153564 RepID=UPI00325D8802